MVASAATGGSKYEVLCTLLCSYNYALYSKPADGVPRSTSEPLILGS